MKLSFIRIAVIIVLALCLGFVLWPLFRSGFFISDDGEWMIIRLSAFYQSLASGQFPVRFLGRLNHSYGYPVANFLYPGFLYVGSLMRFIGIPFPEAIKLILGSSVIGSAIVLYFILRHAFSRLPSIIGVVSFIFTPYLSYDLYKRGSVGEVFGLFASTVCWYAIVRQKVWLVGICTGLLIVSHNTTALIMGFALGCVALFYPKPSRTITGMIFGMGMTMFFWLPAIVERVFVQFSTIQVAMSSEYFLSLSQLGFLSIPLVVSIFLWFIFDSKKTTATYLYFLLSVIGIVLTLPISALVWNAQILEKLIQFPFRFLLLPSLFGSWIVAALIAKLSGWKKNILIFGFAMLWLSWLIPFQKSIEFVNRPLGYYVTNEGTTTVANEYMPVWVTQLPKNRPAETLEIIDGDATITDRTFIGEYMDIFIDAKETSILQINKIYYPGWGVAIDGNAVPIERSNGNGIMRIEVPTGSHRIIAAFRETPMRFAADLLSIASLLIFLYFIKRTNKLT